MTNLAGGVYDMLNTPLLVSQIGVLTKMGVIFQKFKGVKTKNTVSKKICNQTKMNFSTVKKAFISHPISLLRKIAAKPSF